MLAASLLSMAIPACYPDMGDGAGDDQRGASSTLGAGSASGTGLAPSNALNCCLCVYQPQPACAGQRHSWLCIAAHNDCMWVNGTCISRHQRDCSDWRREPAQQNWCDRMWTYPRTAGPPNLSQCTAIRWRHEGHGQNCAIERTRVLVCLNKAPSCTSIEIDDTGCSVFDDISAARAHMQRLVSQLGGSQCATVSANQCIASNRCQSRYVFTVTSSGVCENAAPCTDGGRCERHGEVALCTAGQGTTSQVCCCGLFGCKWRQGKRSCD